MLTLRLSDCAGRDPEQVAALVMGPRWRSTMLLVVVDDLTDTPISSRATADDETQGLSNNPPPKE